MPSNKADFHQDRDLTQAQAEALDEAAERPPAKIKGRDLPSQKRLNGGKMTTCLILLNDIEELSLTLSDMMGDQKCRHQDTHIAIAEAVLALTKLHKELTK